jgi:hypothetical protein
VKVDLDVSTTPVAAKAKALLAVTGNGVEAAVEANVAIPAIDSELGLGVNLEAGPQAQSTTMGDHDVGGLRLRLDVLRAGR